MRVCSSLHVMGLAVNTAADFVWLSPARYNTKAWLHMKSMVLFSYFDTYAYGIWPLEMLFIVASVIVYGPAGKIAFRADNLSYALLSAVHDLAIVT